MSQVSDLPLTRRTRAAAPDRGRRPLAGRVLSWLHRWRWPIGVALTVALAAGVVAWADVRPGFDPYGWIGWGHLTLHGKLNTDGAPSWKPLPYLFTLPYALFGRASVYLWMTTAYAVSFSGLLFAWRVAYWLVDPYPERRWAGHVAGLVAALAVLGIYNYAHSILTAESDTMIVALCLAAADAILCRRYRWAFWALWLAALGRPEAWSLLFVYGAWAFIRQPGMRWQVAVGFLLVPTLWFGIPALTAKSPFSAANLAENSPRALQGDKFSGVLSRFAALQPLAIKVAAVAATAIAVLRREWRIVVLAGGVLLWVAVEIAFAVHGWSAVPRYIYEAGAGVGVLGAVMVGRLLTDLGAWLAAARVRISPALALAAGLVIVVALTATLVPVARSRVRFVRTDLHQQRARAVQVDQLEDALEALGRERILSCGHPKLWIAWQSVLAYELGRSVGSMFFSASYQRRHPHAIVNLYPHDYGWQIFASDWTDAEQQKACAGLRYKTGQ